MQDGLDGQAQSTRSIGAHHDSTDWRMDVWCHSIDPSGVPIDQNKGGKGRVGQALGEERRRPCSATAPCCFAGRAPPIDRSIDLRIENRPTGM